MSKFSPIRAETRDIALATTRHKAGDERKAGRKTYRSIVPSRSQLPALRCECGTLVLFAAAQKLSRKTK